MAQAISVFDPSNKVVTNEVNENLYKTGDKLQSVLLTRLNKHIKRQIDDPEKRQHWCLKWAANNMAQTGTLMVLFNHTQEDCKCLDENET